MMCGTMVMEAGAEQLVTKETHDWAKKTIQEEQALPGAPSKNTLVVLYFKNNTGKAELDPLQKGLTLMLITDLSEIKDLQLIERIKLQALTEELGLGKSGIVAPESAPQVGKLLRAQWLLGGDLTGGNADRLAVLSKLLEVPTTTVIAQPKEEGALQELLRMEKDLVFEVVKVLNIEVKPDLEKVLRKPCSTNMKALNSLFRGIDASDRGNYNQAADLYSEALQEDPNVCIAGSALNELKNSGYYSERGTSMMIKKRGADLMKSLSDRTSQTIQLTPTEVTRQAIPPNKAGTPTTINVIFQ
jgi:TolB-like protein